MDQGQIKKNADPVNPEDAPPDSIDAPSLDFNQKPEKQQGPLLLFWFLIEIQGWGIDGIWWGIFWVNWIGVLLNLSLVHYFLPKDE